MKHSLFRVEIMSKKLIKKESLLLYSFLLLVVVLPFTMILAPISLGILLAVYLLFGDKLNLKTQFKKNASILILIAFYLFQVLGLFYSLEYGFTYKRIEVLLPLFIIPVLFVLLKLKLEQIKMAKNVFVLSCILFCVLALFMLGYNLIVNYEHRLDYNFVQTSMYHFHYPYDVLYLNVANVLLLFGNSKRYNKLLVSGLFFIIIILSGVRIGLFTFFLISLIFLIKNFKKLLNIRTVIIAFLLLVGSLILINSSRYVSDKFFDSLNNLGLNTNEYVSDIGANYHKLTLRNKLWETSIIAIKEKIFLGYGPKGSQSVLNDLYLKKGYNNLLDLNSHNQFLTTLLDSGIVGLTFLLMIILSLLFKVKSIEQFLAIFVFIISFSTESVLVRQKGIMLFSIFFTLFLMENSLNYRIKNK
jgi:O-antigen ligase